MHMIRYGVCCYDCLSVFMVMHVCGCMLGVQLVGRCCWHRQWMYLVRVTGSVVGLAGFFGCVCSTLILRNLSYYMYISRPICICHVVVLHVTCKIVCSRKANFYVKS